MRRLRSTGAIAGAWVAVALTVGPVAAEKPDGPAALTGETLIGTGIVTALGDCRDEDPVTFELDVSGPATGPYTGMHRKEATVRVQFGVGLLDGTVARVAPRLGFEDTIVRDYSARFRIVSPGGLVTGTESGGGTFAGWWAACDTSTGEVTFHPQGSTAALFVGYDATIHSRGGSYQTAGGVRVNISGTVGPDAEGAATITETFTSGTTPER